MNAYSAIFDTQEELFIQRYKHGVQLVKNYPKASSNNLLHLYTFPFAVCFMDNDSRFISGNDGTAQVIGAISKEDIHGRLPSNFWNTASSNRFIEMNKKIIQTGAMMVLEKHGFRLDNSVMNAISFKFPWYFEDRIIGVFDCSIPLEIGSLSTFSIHLSELISAGLLISELKIPSTANFMLSNRENQVMKYLAQGYTAKAIAGILQLSPRTVEHHVENIKAKAQCTTKTQLIRKYFNNDPS